MNPLPSGGVLIVAPHVDDETIGCFSVLEKVRTTPSPAPTTVLYLNELTEERKKEAANASAHFNFCPVFDARKLEAQRYQAVYIPNRQDAHPDHKQANAQFRSIATHFYSVDMRFDLTVLGPEVSARKRQALDLLYPSQADLWRVEHKFWLFESIVRQDFIIYEKTEFRGYQFWTDTERAPALQTWLWDNESLVLSNLPDQLFNEILRHCGTGHVTMRTPQHKEYVA